MDLINGTHPDLSIKPLSTLPLSPHDKNTENDIHFLHQESPLRIRALEAITSSAVDKNDMQRLGRPGTLAVVASIDPDLLGGGLHQFLKCLTAAKIAKQLSERAIEAVGVCWIRSCPAVDGPMRKTVHLLDADRRLHRIQERLDRHPDSNRGTHRFFGDVAELAADIEMLGRGSFDSGILSALRAACNRQDSDRSFLAKLLDDLMRPWGILVMDSSAKGFRPVLERIYISSSGDVTDRNPGQKKGFPDAPSSDYTMQSLIFPRLLSVVNPDDISPFLQARNIGEAYGSFQSWVWPAVSATMVDVDSLRTMKKYELEIRDLFPGEETLMASLRERLPASSTGDSLDVLKGEAARLLDTFNAPEQKQKTFQSAIESCKGRILFQLQKIQNRLEFAGAQKLEVLERRIPRLCASLFPDGRMQERGLSGIYFFLKHRRALLSLLFEKLDIDKREHQIIEV